jgi:hypothetical protein
MASPLCAVVSAKPDPPVPCCAAWVELQPARENMPAESKRASEEKARGSLPVGFMGSPVIEGSWPVFGPSGLSPAGPSRLRAPVGPSPARVVAVRRAHHRGRVGAVQRAPPGPSWSASRWRAPGRGGAVRGGAPRGRGGAVRRARHRAELELSEARTPGPRWSCRTRAPLGRGGAVRRAPPGRAGALRDGPPWCRAGAVRRARHRAEVELSDAGASGRAGAVGRARLGPSWGCPRAPRAELAL